METPSPAGPALDTSAADHLLSTTRAVRRRLDLERPVGRDVILECLRLAVQAPTGGNRQTWRWVVVTDQAKRTRIAELFRERGDEILQVNLDKVAPGDEQGRRAYEGALYLSSVLDRVPALVIPCIEGRVDGASNAAAAGFYGSILPAVWSFMLALRSRGLGSVWTTIHLMREKEVAEVLGIPDSVSQVALLPVAYTKGLDFKPAVRPPVEDITYWDGWAR
jgi:nitroreductase